MMSHIHKIRSLLPKVSVTLAASLGETAHLLNVENASERPSAAGANGMAERVAGK